MDEKGAAAAPNVRNSEKRQTRARRRARRLAAEDALAAHFNDPNYDLRPGTPPPPYQSVESLSLGPYDVTPAPDPVRSAEEGIGSDTQPPPSSDGQVDGTEADNSPVDTSQADSTSTASPRKLRTKYEEAAESPYAEVRAAVPNVDCPWMPVNTFRTWFLGLFFTVLVSGINQLFSMRYPSILITGLVSQLAALPLGKVLEWILPTTRFHTFGHSWSLNPGPFSIKEHVVITIMANVVTYGAYATDIVATQQIFYKQPTTYSYRIMLYLSTQLVGFSLGGLLRQFVVWPASMIWPGALVSSALFTTLHKNYGMPKNRRMSRGKFFCIAAVCSFVWYWIPGYLWTGLSVFNWICWAAPKNIVINQLFGTVTGLGMGVLTLDWSVISYIGSPLVTPWWSQANTMLSFLILIWIITPILYYTNTWYAKFLPMSAHQAFSNTGLPYDPTAIITNGQFDAEKYRAYSPLFIATTQQLSYAMSLAAFSAIVVHTLLWNRSDIARRFKNSIWDEHDIHARLMQVYREVPHWWYAILGILSVVLLSIAIEHFPTELPIWGMLLGLLLSGILAIPITMIQAITNQQIGLNVISELIAGYLFEGKPVANMILKGIGVMVCGQASSFSGDMKLGHYMKVPPRVMFAAQTIAVFVSCFVVEGVQSAMLANIPDICTPHQKSGYTCPSTNTFATASLVWGGIGPRRLFSPGARYHKLLLFLPLGALAPIPFYFLSRRYPYSFWRYINMPVFFYSITAIPPATAINYSSWGITGFIFNFVIRRRNFRWWMQYNYILSAALDSGVILCMIVIFFVLQLPKGGIALNWWGNTVWQNTADANGTPFLTLGDGETFGPKTWS